MALDEAVTLFEEDLALDEERASEMAGNVARPEELGSARLGQRIRFRLSRGPVERRSAAKVALAEYRLPLEVSFLPTAGCLFAHAFLRASVGGGAETRIMAVRPTEQRAPTQFTTETTSEGSLGLKRGPLEARLSGTRRQKFVQAPVMVRGDGAGSTEADWHFDAGDLAEGLPSPLPLELDMLTRGSTLAMDFRLTAGVRWKGIMSVLPFPWPRGEFERQLVLSLAT